MLSRQTRELAEVINDKPDMECVLIVGSFLDQCLASLLRRYFVKSETADNLLSFKKGNLREFASRIKMCYCLGLITKGMLKNLETIGEIRNLFGHTHLSLDFANFDIEKLCNNLTYPKIHEIVGGDGNAPFAQVHGSRNRFATISFMLAGRLLLTGLATTHRERLEQGWE